MRISNGPPAGQPSGVSPQQGLGWWAELLEPPTTTADTAPSAPHPTPVEGQTPTPAPLDDGATPSAPTPPWMRPGAWRGAPRGVALAGATPEPSPVPLSPRTSNRRPARVHDGAQTPPPADADRALAEELLPVLRSLERAARLSQRVARRSAVKQSADEETLQQQTMLTQTLVSLWARTRDILGYHGLTLIDPLGERFDPERCLPIRSMSGTGHPHGTVIEVLARGYALDGRVLAQAEVTVAWDAPRKTGPSPRRGPATRAPRPSES